MKGNFQDVRDFHIKYKLPVDAPAIAMKLMAPDVFSFRYKFLIEECAEFLEATHKKDIVKAVDSLIDLVYVADGTVLFMNAGESCLSQRYAWPTFSLVRDRSQEFGFLAGAPKHPTLLDDKTLEFIERRILGDISLFQLSHELGMPNALPLALAHLWTCAWNGYLAAALMGVNEECWENCWSHVHTKNMEKVRADGAGSNSLRKTSWDVVKPEGWTPPDQLIKKELERWSINSIR